MILDRETMAQLSQNMCVKTKKMKVKRISSSVFCHEEVISPDITVGVNPTDLELWKMHLNHGWDSFLSHAGSNVVKYNCHVRIPKALRPICLQ